MPQPLLVTDGPHLLYRAFYALPDTITNDDGMAVNALLGSANQTLWCVEKYAPRAVVFCFEPEADDLLHSLAVAETATGGHTLILTGDRDMLQCVNDSVTVLLQRARQQGPDEMDADAVREMYGVDPEQVPDFIALRGDPSASNARRTCRPTSRAAQARPASWG